MGTQNGLIAPFLESASLKKRKRKSNNKKKTAILFILLTIVYVAINWPLNVFLKSIS